MPKKTSVSRLKPQKIASLPVAPKRAKMPTHSAATMAARRQVSTRYCQKNLEQEREKARKRMARSGFLIIFFTSLTMLPSSHRDKVLQQDDLADDFRARAREASRRFRQKNGTSLAHRQCIIRLGAYEKKHGHRAWLARQKELQERREAAQELNDYCRREAELDRILGPGRP
ncbi:hypothetical protein K438DRAFT_1997696 [Mycena galopus ATCC 62051]|nr:hypothetical protein K438DRAFT_1997696 [Mycena galopus ATCC 62051]